MASPSPTTPPAEQPNIIQLPLDLEKDTTPTYSETATPMMKDQIQAVATMSSSLESTTSLFHTSSIGSPSNLEKFTPGETSSRKRDYHRRKSDPVSLKKIPKLEPTSPEKEFNDFNSNNLIEREGFEKNPFLEEQDDDDTNEIMKDPDFRPRETSTSNRRRKSDSSYRVKLGPQKINTEKNEQDEQESSSPTKTEGMYHFHWKNHQGHILSSFSSLLEDETFCDVTLICDANDDDKDGELIVPLKAHRIVLSACSDYFRQILGENPCKHPIIVLKDYPAWEVQALLDFMYRGEVDIGKEKVDALVKTAKSLQIRGLNESLCQPTTTIPNNKPEDNNPFLPHNTPQPLPEIEHHNILLPKALNLSYPQNHQTKQRNRHSHHHLQEVSTTIIIPPGVESIGESSSTSDDTPVDILDLNNSSSLSPQNNHTNNAQHLNLIMPRRKQARPRRRSGDYIAQDLRKISDKMLQNEDEDNDEDEYDLDKDDDERDSFGEDGFDEDDEEMEHFPQLPMNVTNLNKLLSRRLLSDASDMVEQKKDGDLSPKIEELVLHPPRRRSSRLNYREGDDDEDDVYDDDRGQENVSTDHDIIDYTTTTTNSGGGGGGGFMMGGREKRGRRKERGGGGINNNMVAAMNANNDSLQQQHLAFLRNYNWAMAQRGKLAKLPDSDLDEHGEIPHHHHHHRSLTPSSRTPPRKVSPSPKSFLHRPDPLSSFPFLPGLIPPNNPSPPIHSSNKHNSSSSLPPNCFLSSSGAMSITPLGSEQGRGNGGDETTTTTTNSSPSPFSPMNHHIGLEELAGHHPGQQPPPPLSSSRHGGKYKEGQRGSPGGHHHPHWPGLPLGPPPIFGRHRAQHSAPRGGPPRAWSNADLTEALHNVWNKKMTTSQASRIFGIPYNSLLMYVRGKYGKSLKLDVLKKGLDQAMENSANNAANAAAAALRSSSSGNNNGTSITPSSSSTPNNNNNNNNSSPTSRSSSKSSPPPLPLPQPPTNNRGSPPTISSTSAVTALLHSLHHNNNKISEKNNNHNPHHHHHHHHHTSSKVQSSTHQHQNGGGGGSDNQIPLPPDHGNIPAGFNPFFFGDFGGNPFPFASALQHILPPHLTHAMAAQHHHLHNNNNHLNGPHPGGVSPTAGQQQSGGVMDMD